MSEFDDMSRAEKVMLWAIYYAMELVDKGYLTRGYLELGPKFKTSQFLLARFEPTAQERAAAMNMLSHEYGFHLTESGKSMAAQLTSRLKN
jgi:hypothetical protein